MPTEKKSTLHWNPAATGLVTSAAIAAVLVPAYLRNLGPTPGPASLPVFIILGGGFACLCHVRKYWLLLGGGAAGLIVAALSTVGLIGQDVQGLYGVVAATFVLFFLLGAFIGGFFEFVFYLHRTVHRGDGDEAQLVKSIEETEKTAK